MLENISNWLRLLSADGREQMIQKQLADARKRIAVPVFWLFGKTQSGKSTIIKYLTGATSAEVGNGLRPCTRYSQRYEFPSTDVPLLTFLDTRGLDEPGYDPAEDLASFHDQAHLMVVTVKVMDHAQERSIHALEEFRSARPSRPVVLALTCLHEAYPQQQHPQPYPFTDTLYPPEAPYELQRSLAEQERRFAPLVDVIVPIDITQPEEGFTDPIYGGEQLKHVLQEKLPEAYRQTLLTLDHLTNELKDAYLRQALPVIVAYSSLAGAIGAFPLPFLDLLALPVIQLKMVHELGKLYGQPLSAERFMELATTLGMGMLARQATRELTKFIPGVGNATSAALAATSTYALGRAFCYYYQSTHEGHVPHPDELKKFFEAELKEASIFWKSSKGNSR